MSSGGAQHRRFGPYFDALGAIYRGIRINVFAAGTTTNKTYWTDEGKVTPGSFPLIDTDLDGIVSAYFDGDYRFQVKDTGGLDLDDVIDDDNVKVTSDNSTLWEGTQGTATPTASASNKGAIFSLFDASSNVVGFLINRTAKFVSLVRNEVNADWYTSFEAAITAIGASTKTLVVSNVQTVAANTTVPSNVTLVFTGDNGSLSVNTSITVTINGPLEAPLRQVFSGAGSVVLGDGYVFEMSPNHWGAKADGSTNSSAAFQSAVDSGVRRLILTEGQYLASNVQLDVAIQGITLVGHGRSEAGTTATQMSNNATTPLITTKGSGSLNNFTVRDVSFTQTSSAQGHIFEFVNDYFNLQINDVYCILSNTAKSFFKSNGVYSAVWTIRNTKVVMATGATVSALDIVSTTSQPTFGWMMERTQWNSDSTATAPAVKIHDGSSNSNAGGIINGILFQNTYGGALELGSQQNVTVTGMQVADVTGDPTQALFLIKKIGGQPSYNITIIGSDIQHTFTAVADLEVETASSQGGVTIISSTVRNILAQNQRPVIISGVTSYNFMGTTLPVYIAHSGRLGGIGGISGTATLSLNLRGNDTFVTSGTKAVTFANPAEPDTSYEIFLGTQLNETFWVTSKTTSGFTLNSSNASSTATVGWLLVR